MDAVNRQVRLAARPVGLPKASDWDHTEEAVAEPGEGEVLVKVKYLSIVREFVISLQGGSTVNVTVNPA
jgi:NADPH-dependent curcumin reductase CurA